MPVHSFRVGKGARLVLLGNLLKMLLQEGTVTESAPHIDGTSPNGGGAEEGDVGISRVSVDCSIIWDPSNNYYDYGISPGILGNGFFSGSTRFYISVSDAAYWYFPRIEILSVGNQVRVNGIITFPFVFKNWGSYIRPTNLLTFST